MSKLHLQALEEAPGPSAACNSRRTIVSKLHLQALEEALLRKGWRIIAVHPGDGYRISATWEVQRSSKRPTLFIDFEGLEDRACLPLEGS